MAACLEKVLKEKCRFVDDEDKPVLPHKETMAEKKSKTQPIVPPKKDKPPPKKGESSLASELWQLNRKRSQSPHQLRANKLLKGNFDSSLPRITVDSKANITKNTIEDKPVNKNIDEALDKAANSCSLRTYLYGLDSSSNKKPKRKYLPKKKPMSTTLAFDFNTYYGNNNNESHQSISNGWASINREILFSRKFKRKSEMFRSRQSVPTPGNIC